jgi:hypothetical protein
MNSLLPFVSVGHKLLTAHAKRVRALDFNLSGRPIVALSKLIGWEMWQNELVPWLEYTGHAFLFSLESTAIDHGSSHCTAVLGGVHSRNQGLVHRRERRMGIRYAILKICRWG